MEKDEKKECGIENNDEIIYKINKKENKTKIFGRNFVEKNSDKCIIKYKNKTYKLTEYLEVENEEQNNNLDYRIIKIKLKGINNVTDMSYMFSDYSSLSYLPDFSN